MSGYDFDLFVIGGGSGGVRASRIASQYGAKVGIAEEHRMGGTCVIRGCVPKKLMVYASHFPEVFEDAEGYGWSKPTSTFDWKTLIAKKDAEIDRLNGIYIRNLEKAGVEIFDSRAELVDAHTVKLVAEDRTVSAKRILIATGGTPFLDDSLEGMDHSITSNEVFYLDEMPKRIVIAGAGYIAIEFAGIFAGFGAETTLVYRGNEILRGFDDDVRVSLREEMEKKGVRFVLNTTFSKLEKDEAGVVHCHTSNGEVIEADQVLFAIGRKPAVEGLGLENAGVEVNEKGAILVDAYSQTNVESIYAVGDVTDRVNLTPVAIREGHAFADTVYGGKPVVVDHSKIATAVFSQPEIGTVGLSEADAVAEFGDVDIYLSRFRPMKYTLPDRDEKMVMKIVVDATSDKVVGCHILGPDAGEMAQLLGIAVKMGATKADFGATMAVHPTAAEELVTMREPSRTIRR